MRRRDAIEEVRNRSDIVDLVSSYLPLTRAGQNLKARCPFHEEKTPSFVVSPERQTFYCFGCREKGGVFDFVMKMERVEFGEALELLAEQTGVTLEDEGNRGEEQRSQKAELYRLHRWTDEYFCRMLRSQEGSRCLEYVTSRGISQEMIQEFRIGYAPDGYTTLIGRAGEAGFRPALLEKAGLARPGVKRPGHWSFFRDRLIFSILDAMGRTVAFGARSLDGSEPKYLNSPETEIFHKSKTLFGIDRLRQHPRQEPILVMEGYTDVVMSEQVGVKGAVATLGTALTPEHARVLSRYADRTILVYDGDPAGLAAAERGALILLAAGHIDIKVAVLPQGEDPCDFFRARGTAGREELLEITADLIDFLIERRAAEEDLGSMDGRRAAAGALVRAAAAIADPLDREVVLERVAERLSFPLGVVREAAGRHRSGARSTPPRSRSASEEAPQVPDVKLDTPHREILESVVNQPGLAEHAALEEPEVIEDTRVRSVIRLLVDQKASIAGQPGRVLDFLEDPSLRELARTSLLPENHGRDLPRQLEGAVTCLKNRRTLEEARRLKREAVESGDAQLLKAVQRRFQTLKGGNRTSEATEEGPLG